MPVLEVGRLEEGLALSVLVLTLLLWPPPPFKKLVRFKCAWIDVDDFCCCWWALWLAPGSGEVSMKTRRCPFMVFMPVKIDFLPICDVLFTKIVDRSGVHGDCGVSVYPET